jgi:NADPH-dependent glutamate synthase beta subunit-like oxidoreductase
MEIVGSRFGLNFEDLYDTDGLIKLYKKFNEFLEEKNPEIYQRFISSSASSAKEQNVVIIDVSRLLEDFIVELFNIEQENSSLKNEHKNLQKIYFVKREFVQRIVAKKYSEAPSGMDLKAILSELRITYYNITELEKKLADEIFELLEIKQNQSQEEKKKLDLLTIYAALALFSYEGKNLHKNGTLFKLPQKIDHQDLLGINNSCYSSIKKTIVNNIEQIKCYCASDRIGFDLTDQGFNLNQTLGETNYCIFCHRQEKDSCRSGLKEKDRFKKDSSAVDLTGCPLDQKISEMNLLKSEGFSIAALAVAIIDNPMIAGTGHRICNDCTKACIFQKQSAVDIPQIETKILKDVLSLPYGFEIYSLLTRFNPINFQNPLPKKFSGKKVLVAGLGPAGYTLSHYLLNEGYTIVAIDGLKIEPLNPIISGIDEFGVRKKFKPIKFLNEIYESLSTRTVQGFGGVSEYGITARWDKNFLKIIRLLLERRKNFFMFGSLRFGSSITEKIAFDDYGFDHIALCIGAGRPNIIDIKNYAKGVRFASDFLMSLHLGGAFQEASPTNLQVRMPILVIGGGLTAIDTATEAKEYYITQIKKFAKKIADFREKKTEEKFFQSLNNEEKIIAEEFLNHVRELDTSSLGRDELFEKWGGVKIIYRKKIQDSPAYKLNHEELKNAIKEGVIFIENIIPEEAITDEFNHIKALKAINNDKEVIFECKSLIVATGTSPNITPALEDNLDVKLDGKYFEIIDENGNKIAPENSAKPTKSSILTKIRSDGKAISFFGDLHPNFSGSVVKAMASAKSGYKIIDKILDLS